MPYEPKPKVILFALLLAGSLAVLGCSTKQLPTPADTICSLKPIYFEKEAEVDALSASTLKAITAVNCSIYKRCDGEAYLAACTHD